ncbi:hypothetical protein [Pseudomonas sp. SWI44]|uniref:hypothetical protein n=1 Tax=Pseudomonas sp. SWI44 TaxID=2083053 RepID=UPI000CE5D339|nr:hypothetical protein [Pseudomonas sp. SWI44]AVD86244.1 hypothetical protein C4Q26_03390 [Pseudomonas sp. SWI44]
MPTENRSSITEAPTQHSQGRRERFQKWVIETKHPVLGYLDGSWLARGDDREGYADKYVQGLWVAYKEFAQPVPQPHPEPIAWMVGTAFWWTKEEAERDSAEVGQPVIGLGSMIDTVEVERLRAENIRLIEDRARFPDRPDDIGIMIGSHIGSLKNQVKSSEGYARKWRWELEAAKRKLSEREALLKRCEDSLFNLLCFGVAEDRTEADKLIEELRSLSASAEPHEREQGIPGTSFQRLNMLANQGE